MRGCLDFVQSKQYFNGSVDHCTLKTCLISFSLGTPGAHCIAGARCAHFHGDVNTYTERGKTLLNYMMKDSTSEFSQLYFDE